MAPSSSGNSKAGQEHRAQDGWADGQRWRRYQGSMGYVYLILTIVAFMAVSTTLRRRFVKPVDPREADEELNEKLREIRRDERG